MARSAEGAAREESPQGEEPRPERRANGTLLPGHKVGLATRFAKGVSGNPGGTSAAQRVAREFEALLTAQIGGGLPDAWRPRLAKALGVQPYELDDMTLEQIILSQVGLRAAEGDIAFVREITERLMPKPRRLELTGEDGAPIEVRSIEADMDVVEAAALYEATRRDD